MNKEWNRDDVSPFMAACLSRLKWIELRLGRLPETLAWHEFDLIVKAILRKQGIQPVETEEDHHQFDAILAILLLKTDFWELKNLDQLPDRLEELGLDCASCSLLYSLGHTSELQILFDEKDDFDSYTMFLALRDQPASDDMPDRPDLCNSMKGAINSKVLGCHVVIEFPNQSPFVEVAESILAAMESAFATGITDRVMSREPKLAIEIRKVDFSEAPLTYKFSESNGELSLQIHCTSFEMSPMNRDSQIELKECLSKIIIEAALRTLMIDEEEMNRMFGVDGALHRAIDFTGSLQTLCNTIGTDRENRGWEWVNNDNYKTYTQQRSKPWDADDLKVTQTRKFPNPDSQATRPQN